MLIEPHAFGAGQALAPYSVLADDSATRVIEVGLVNNMPDSALKDTERQFRALLQAAAGDDVCVSLHFLSLSGVARGPEARAHMCGRYADASEVGGSEVGGLPLDALIITGAEPRARNLRDETFWPELARLFDWAGRHAVSTIFSCLAAHAAALHFDGVERRPVGFKRSGIFECEVVRGHVLTRGLPRRIAIPHSRYNELDEDDLRRAGYEILTRSRQAGVDTYARTRGGRLMLFFQGHPEYRLGSIPREYRRDVLRFLNCERDDYPIMPCNTFTPEQEQRLFHFRRRAMAQRSPGLGAELPLSLVSLGDEAGASDWADTATTLYRNWLRFVAEAKRSNAPHIGALR